MFRFVPQLARRLEHTWDSSRETKEGKMQIVHVLCFISPVAHYFMLQHNQIVPFCCLINSCGRYRAFEAKHNVRTCSIFNLYNFSEAHRIAASSVQSRENSDRVSGVGWGKKNVENRRINRSPMAIDSVLMPKYYAPIAHGFNWQLKMAHTRYRMSNTEWAQRVFHPTTNEIEQAITQNTPCTDYQFINLLRNST